MVKDEIRKMMRSRRKTLSAADRSVASKAICAMLLVRNAVRQAIETRRPIAVYLASPEEVDLTDFIVAALSRGALLLAPRWNGSLYELAPLASLENLVVGLHGILEPPRFSKPQPATFSLRPDVWLLPGLAFTNEGKRLGYGGGWYDRLLAESGRDSVKIGVAFKFQVVADVPEEPHDRRMTEVMTEDGVLTSFARSCPI